MSDVTLSPSMTQQDMDRFLSSLGAESNPFTVEDLFAGRKDDMVWSQMQSALNLDNATAAKLALALKQASQQPAAPAAVPTQKQQVDAATRNRIEALVNAKAGELTSIFGTDEHGRPVCGWGRQRGEAGRVMEADAARLHGQRLDAIYRA